MDGLPLRPLARACARTSSRRDVRANVWSASSPVLSRAMTYVESRHAPGHDQRREPRAPALGGQPAELSTENSDFDQQIMPSRKIGQSLGPRIQPPPQPHGTPIQPPPSLCTAPVDAGGQAKEPARITVAAWPAPPRVAGKALAQSPPPARRKKSDRLPRSPRRAPGRTKLTYWT